MRSILIAFAISSSLVSPAFAQQVDEKAPTCAANPAELQTQPDTLARVAAMGGLDGLLGTWQLSGIPFKKDKLSFDYDSQNFYVQSGDETRETVSLCAEEAEPVWIRISVHTPGCPENKNVRIKNAGPNRMHLKAYATRAIGTATFKKIADRPLPEGTPNPNAKCAQSRFVNYAQ